MKKRTAIALSMALLAAAGIATSASAHEKTRAEVRQELIQGENDGTRFVTDDVARIYQMQAAQRTQQSADGYGADMGDSSASGKATGSQTHATPASCLGPVNFCRPFFGR